MRVIHALFNAILIIALVMIGFTLYEDFRVNYYYTETKCLITKNSYIKTTHEKYRSMVQVSYLVNDASYSKWISASRVNPDLDTEVLAKARLNQYPINSSVVCWFDPAHPAKVTLEKGYNSKAVQTMVIIILWFLWSTIGMKMLIRARRKK